MNKKRYNNLILLILVVIPVFLSAGEIPALFITMERKMQRNFNKLNKDKQIEFHNKFNEVKKNLKRIYKKMWDEFDSRGEGVLPWCIFQVFKDLKNRSRIPLKFSIRNKKTIPSGDKALSKTKVGEFSEHKGIVIYGVYRDYFTYGWSRESTCLKATLFHEILHFATFYGNKSYFNIRKIRNQNGSAYFSSSHPVLSSSPGGLVQIAVDGHFPKIPTGATVILKKRTNNEPVLLHYKYGQGSVILTSLYSDWGYAHSQASEFELKIVRDLITFAKNPDLSIPTFDMDVIPNPFIGLNVDVGNDSEYPAAKVRLVAYTPDRNIALHEAEQNISLNPGEETVIPFNFTLPGYDVEPGMHIAKTEQCSAVIPRISGTDIDKIRQSRYKYYESKTLG